MLLRPVLILVSLAGAFALESLNKDLTLTNVDRTMDMASQLVKMSSKLTVNNGGSSPVKSFHYTVDENVVDKVAFIGATVSLSFTCQSSKRYLKDKKQIKPRLIGETVYFYKKFQTIIKRKSKSKIPLSLRKRRYLH